MSVKAEMPFDNEVRTHRAAQVQRLSALARKHGEQQLKDGTAKKVVEALIATLESKRLGYADKKELADAAAQYRESFTKPRQGSSNSDTEHDEQDVEKEPKQQPSYSSKFAANLFQSGGMSLGGPLRPKHILIENHLENLQREKAFQKQRH